MIIIVCFLPPNFHFSTDFTTETTENMALFLDVLRSVASNEAYPLAKKRTVGGGASLKRCSSGFL